MEALVAAVKHRSLGAAAEQLGISRTLVSRQIQALEAELGVRLMNRTTRSLSLTDAGRRYFDFCDEILTRVADMDRQISSAAAEARGEIAILAPKWMHRSATHLLTEFALSYPDIRPKLILGGMAQTAYGFLEQGCDIALHTRQIPDSRITARKIVDIPYCLCASPGYVESVAPIQSPVELSAMKTLVQYNYHTWQFESGGRQERLQPAPALSANTFSALKDAALQGLGIALLPLPLIREELAEGLLKPLLPDWTPAGQTLYVAIAPGSGVPAKVRLLLDHIVDWFSRNEL